MNKEVTLFCWNCGRQCAGLFCNDKCRKAHERKASPKTPKKYGVTGYTSGYKRREI